ncbi:MAG TPA: OsmC family protein [Ornithinibacter sp.]|nr:OsmC family protein [Ornithinibacter sp.]
MAHHPQQETGGTGPGHRTIAMSRSGTGTYVVTNARGGTISIGSGENDDFTPVELFLTAIAGCSAVDVDFITSRLAEPTEFTVTAGGEKMRDEHGNHMGEIEVSFRVRFPRGADGDRARERLPRAIAQSHDRLCTVSRSVQLGTPIHMRED